MKIKINRTKILVTISIIVPIILLSILEYKVCSTREAVKSAKVIDKERITRVSNGESSSYYLIYTDKGEFKVEDNLFMGLIMSSRIYGGIEKGKCYDFNVYGFRNGLLSMYQNIYGEVTECDCVKND